MKKREIIIKHLKGESFREIERSTGMNRKTISRICKVYDAKQKQLEREDLTNEEKDEIIRAIVESKSYNTENRSPRKVTGAILKRLEDIAQEEIEKTKLLGKRHKQKLNGRSVHEILIDEGYDIAYRTMMVYWKEITEKAREAFIRQDYEYGERVEYDFGEVKLYIKGCVETYHLAAFAAPASGFRWAYLYKSQKMEVFLDSHVQFFELVQGVYAEVVYDNMRNVVSKFVGRKKELNKQLVHLSLYYGFDIFTTNPNAGYEKGSVERTVEVIRKALFTKKYKFETFEEAQKHLQDGLITFNSESEIECEKSYLRAYKRPYELSNLVDAKVDKYSCVCLDNNHYSVPEYLVGKVVKVKKYYDHYEIYANNNYVSSHKKIDGVGQYQLDLMHYLKTLRKKPGALKNSLALKQCPQLSSIYQTHFKQNEREFIGILLENTDKHLSEIVDILTEDVSEKIMVNKSNEVEDATRKELGKLNALFGFHDENEGEEELCQLKH
ncbi:MULTISPECIES: IS21 family transposase [unclassified Breznakia]|uniref:Mu transposase domain-containing protein n=1 Tax=unclassified Breznakia TaxID=2623764 RepID=UPI002476C4D0|nr:MULTISPECIES: IS21 family transposase [unclassified Breznakia]MDH6368105.1 transposase [Breznakia sp. PH1-1]MDH6405194.1 transposase [Breznakia sp. PF1-11]MDH6412902.1 transposase [Breznakia sp. PFB1-11]MDH6415264.1 transposase [Breznakia sp. PFB1-14]MDH6417573.1 transposase [Breznakia sp. PFB1-4]